MKKDEKMETMDDLKRFLQTPHKDLDRINPNQRIKVKKFLGQVFWVGPTQTDLDENSNEIVFISFAVMFAIGKIEKTLKILIDNVAINIQELDVTTYRGYPDQKLDPLICKSFNIKEPPLYPNFYYSVFHKVRISPDPQITYPFKKIEVFAQLSNNDD